MILSCTGELKGDWEDLISRIKEGRSPIEKYEEMFLSHKYTIGLHIMYTLAYHQKLSPQKIMNLGIFKLIKMYENTALALSRQPVISASSSKGILDYKKMLSEWFVSLRRK